MLTKERLNQLAPQCCNDPDHKHNDAELFFHGRCHICTSTKAVKSLVKPALIIACGKCSQTIAIIKVNLPEDAPDIYKSKCCRSTRVWAYYKKADEHIHIQCAKCRTPIAAIPVEGKEITNEISE